MPILVAILYLSVLQKGAGYQNAPLKVEGSENKPVFQFIHDKSLIMTVRADPGMVLNDIRTADAADVPDVFKIVSIHIGGGAKASNTRRDRQRAIQKAPIPSITRWLLFRD
ncbi:uncharacterized protein BDW43DRAFT_287285 [Aspergillus alliaceus]|uniref:uncharacterized protein n=1 Tax=Petromyces alliaceus TaxID=209559 RepID=UPI0012A6A58F|nr:uncharacterized protein BDW43DRAFT_287285 [Aspergillus alliaceus]KAB8229903.1 hypothetical protein BDW43DRAFT_287285 [Aspergillus alliaceus]